MSDIYPISAPEGGAPAERRSELDHLGPEGRQRELRQLEELLAEGDAHDRQAPQDADQGIAQGHPDPEDQQPQDVRERRHRAAAVDHLFPEGEEGQARELEALQPEGDPYDRQAAQQPRQQPGQPAEKAAQDEPKHIADKTHRISSFSGPGMPARTLPGPPAEGGLGTHRPFDDGARKMFPEKSEK